MKDIENRVDLASAIISDRSAAYGYPITPKQVKSYAKGLAIYFFVIFCIGAFIEIRRGGHDNRNAFSASLIENETRQYNILTLGGSVTWGAKLDSASDAYPRMIKHLGHHVITNKAIQATSSFYPSICIESLMRGDDIEYDFILFEFSLSGFKNFDVLVKRLQYRYPNAIFIYVHLYSLRAAALTRDGGDSMIWTNKELTVPGESIVKLFDEIGGFIYKFPAPEDPLKLVDLYKPNMIHLSKKGHRLVAKSLSMIFSHAQVGKPTPHKHQQMDNKWGYGDECKSWFITGQIPYRYKSGYKKQISFKDPTDTLDDPGEERTVLQFSRKNNGKNSIVLRNNLKTKSTVPVFFSYILPARKKLVASVTINGITVTLNPNISPYAVVEMAEIGMIQDGLTEATIHIENDSNVETFQLVGVAFYGFRFHSGLPMKRMHNSIAYQDANKLLA